MTGYGPVPVGAYTLRKRQSSSVDPVPKAFGSWTQPLPNLVASRVPVSGAAFCGGFQRRGPTGGAAYGMPLKLRIVAVLLPAIMPTFGTVTTSGVAGPPSGDAGTASPGRRTRRRAIAAACRAGQADAGREDRTGQLLQHHGTSNLPRAADTERSLRLLARLRRCLQCHNGAGVATKNAGEEPLAAREGVHASREA